MRGLIGAGALALVLKLALAWFTTGTNDILTWEHDLARFHSAGFAELYRTGVQYASPDGRAYPAQAFIHPPAVLHLLRIFERLQELSGLPLRFWMRALDAVADSAMLLAIASAWNVGTGVLVVLALSPISILISGFHGNTDPVMMLLIVLAAGLAERGRPALSGLAFGAACGIKLIPLLFAPAIVVAQRRGRAAWIAIAAASWVALSLPYLAREPGLILNTMLGYTSSTGVWGFSLLASVVGLPYDAAGRWIALGAAAMAGIAGRMPLLMRCGFASLVFLFLSPGFGLQYLCWTVPWTVCLGLRRMGIYQAIAGSFLFTVYLAASQGRFDYADLLTRENLTLLMLFGLGCWVEVGAAAWYLARCLLPKSPPPGPSTTGDAPLFASRSSQIPIRASKACERQYAGRPGACW